MFYLCEPTVGPKYFSNKRLWIFDLDGTLIDPSIALARTWAELGVEFDLDLEGFAYENFVGVALNSVLEHLGVGKRDLSLVSSAFNDRMKEHEWSIRPYLGSDEILSKLNLSGSRIVVFTSKSRDRAKSILDSTKWQFDELVALEDVTPAARKPSGWVPLDLLRRYSMKPEQAIFVGDSTFDGESASSAGVDFLWASWGFGKRVRAEITCESATSLAGHLTNC